MKFTLVCVLEKCEKDGGRDGEGAKFCHIGNLGVIYSNSENWNNILRQFSSHLKVDGLSQAQFPIICCPIEGGPN